MGPTTSDAALPVPQARRFLVLAVDPGDLAFIGRFAAVIRAVEHEYGFDFVYGFEEDLDRSVGRHVRRDRSERIEVALVEDFGTPACYVSVTGDDPQVVWLVMDSLAQRLPTLGVSELRAAVGSDVDSDPGGLVRLALAVAPELDTTVVELVRAGLDSTDERVRRAGAEAGRILGLGEAAAVAAAFEAADARAAAEAEAARRRDPADTVTGRLKAANPAMYELLTSPKADDWTWNCFVVRNGAGDVLTCRKTRGTTTAWVIPLVASVEFEDDEQYGQFTDSPQEFPEMAVFDLSAFRWLGGSANIAAAGDESIAVVMGDDYVNIFVHTAPADVDLDPQTFQWLPWPNIAAYPQDYLRDGDNDPLLVVVPDVRQLLERAVLVG
jgi:hypothetical protein